jgi:hypothetical protein
MFDGTGNVATCTYFYIARDVEKISETSPDPGEKIRVFDVSFDELLELSSDTRLHHHWSLIPLFYEARISPQKKAELRNIFFGE